LASHPDTEEPRRRDLVGQRLMERYAVTERIARGGMAVVYRGEDERLHRPVCVKLFFGFRPHQQEYAVVLEHFVQEAFALSRLQHPSTLRIYDFGYLDENARADPFFVTELASGGHLGQLVAGTGGLPPAEMLRLLGPIVGALREAHAADIVHRDLKPSNILLTRAGGELQPKLADFSIAKAQGDLPHRASETNAQAPLYSLSWAAPEQLSGGPIGPPADVFALGLVASYLLTERLVYPGDDVMALYTLRSEGPAFRERSIRQLGLPPAIEAVVLHSSAEEPSERPQTVEELFERLRAAVAATTGEPRPAARAEPTPSDAGVPTPLAHADSSAPSITEPFHSARPAPQLVPPVSPSEPAEGSAPGKPRLPLATLDAPQIVVGHRRVRLRAVSDAPVELPEAIAGRPARLRVTPRELGAGQVHLKGLNCFVRTLEGRPSSGLDVDRPRTVELLDPQSGARGSLHITMGTRPDGSHELELSDVVLVVPAGVARWVVVLEAAGGRDTLLIHSPLR
jgi:eukaryotic-like serine/threonine-protein kinase